MQKFIHTHTHIQCYSDQVFTSVNQKMPLYYFPSLHNKCCGVPYLHHFGQHVNILEDGQPEARYTLHICTHDSPHYDTQYQTKNILLLDLLQAATQTHTSKQTETDWDKCVHAFIWICLTLSGFFFLLLWTERCIKSQSKFMKGSGTVTVYLFF